MDDIRNSLQLIATIIILSTIVLMQLVVFLLLLPIPQVPKVLRLLDVRLNFDDFAHNPSEPVLLNEKQQRAEGRKRAAGGFASAIVFAVVVVISMTTLVITHDEPGTVNYSSNRLLGSLPFKQPNYGVVFTLPHNISADQSLILSTNQLDLNYCQLPSLNGSRRTFSAELFQTYHYNAYDLQPLTVCAPRIKGHYDFRDMVSAEFFTPVYPPVKSYPPPGVFSDVTTLEEFEVLRMDYNIPVLHLYVNFIEMISSSPLDLLAAVATQRSLQAKLTTELTTRRINDTYLEPSHNYKYKWPECYEFNTPNVTYQPLFSMLLHPFSTNSRYTNNMSYVVSQTSLVSWAFTTIITIGSIVALKPSITHYITKLGEYWKMKPAVRWTLFAVYTLVVPMPLVLVVFGAVYTFNANYRYETHQEEYTYLLLAVTSAMNLTWLGMFVRHVKFEVDRRRAADHSELNNNEDEAIALQPAPQYGTLQ